MSLLKFSSAAKRSMRSALHSGQEAFPDAGRVETLFDLPPDLGALASPLLEVLLDLGAMVEVVGDRRVDVGQAERGVLLLDLLRIVDESGDDSLYPKTTFQPIQVPGRAAKALALGS